MDGDGAVGGGGGAPAAGAPAAGAQLIAMQPADLQALAQLMRGGSTKLRRMTEATAEAWLEYKRHFTKIAVLQQWGDERARHELAAGIQEKAGNAVADIDVDEAGVNLDDIIEAFEERFMPAAAGATARKNYQSAKQFPTESVREWHTRTRELFFLAYPGEDPNAQNHCLDIFVNGLSNATVKFFVASQPIAAFVEALPIAERAETANRDNVGAQAGRQQIGAIPSPQGAGGRGPLACYFCLDVFKISSPHLKNNCLYFRAANQAYQAEQRGGQPQATGSNPQGGQKRNNRNRRGKKGGQNRGVNAVVPTDQANAQNKAAEADVDSDSSGN